VLAASAPETPSRDGWVGDLFSPAILSLSARPLADLPELFPEERALVASAGPTRRREFATGRVCARRLLEELGIRDHPLLRAPDRAPLWPAGIAGSISHCADLCVVAMARRETASAIGIDVEPADPLEPELWPSVCTPRELDLLARADAWERGQLAHVLFSAKESIYKCARFAGAPELGFHDVEVSLERGAGRFTGRWRESGVRHAAWRRCSGRYALRGRWIFTGVTFPGPRRGPGD
jgi:4'-phosphopantetheinyl transferase EntD